MRLLVLGAGAVGGYFGGRLAETGADVTFLVRPKRREQLQEHGLQVESPLGSIGIKVKTVLASELKPDYDLVLLTCKAYDLDAAAVAIAPAVRGACTVLPLLNGLAHIPYLDERFGHDKVLLGTCAVNVRLLADGRIRHNTALQRLIFGERDGQSSERTQSFAQLMAKTKVNWELSTNVMQDLWEKIVVLSALAAVTCLFRANVGEIVQSPDGLAAIDRVLRCNIEIATREGYPPRSAIIEFGQKLLTDPSSRLTASILEDLEDGAPVESDHIVGWMLDKARAHQLDDTVLALAYTHLKAYERRRSALRLPLNRLP